MKPFFYRFLDKKICAVYNRGKLNIFLILWIVIFTDDNFVEPIFFSRKSSITLWNGNFWQMFVIENFEQTNFSKENSVKRNNFCKNFVDRKFFLSHFCETYFSFTTFWTKKYEHCIIVGNLIFFLWKICGTYHLPMKMLWRSFFPNKNQAKSRNLLKIFFFSKSIFSQKKFVERKFYLCSFCGSYVLQFFRQKNHGQPNFC